MKTSKFVRENIHSILALNHTLRSMIENTLREIGHFEFDESNEPSCVDYDNLDWNIKAFDMSTGHLEITVYDPYENSDETKILKGYSFDVVETGMNILSEIGNIYDEENPEQF